MAIDTDIYCITGEEFSLGRDNLSVVKELIDADIKVIQYREKNKSKSEKLKECTEIKQITDKAGVTFIINDDVDIAMAIKADGIHIGQGDMPISEVRRLVGKRIIGVSTHNPDQAMKAVRDGADYIGVGPVFETKTKSNVEASAGLDYIKWVSENITIPYVAIGGINEENILLVQRNGGKSFAMISDIVGSKDIKHKIKSIRAKLNIGEMS
nr:thiamine phosphate synthase [Serpentinicella alkaliphila]